MSKSDELRVTFFQESEDLLEQLADGLDEMSGGDADPETVNAVFRAVHSIKGGAGAFALEELVRFAHRYETALDRVRGGDLDDTNWSIHDGLGNLKGVDLTSASLGFKIINTSNSTNITTSYFVGYQKLLELLLASSAHDQCPQFSAEIFHLLLLHKAN